MLKFILLLITSCCILGYADNNSQSPIIVEMDGMNNNSSSLSSSQPDYSVMLKKTIFMVIGLIGIVFLTIYVLKRFATNRTMQVNQIKHIKIIERRSISPKTALYLVQIGDKRMLLSESQLEVRSHYFLPD